MPHAEQNTTLHHMDLKLDISYTSLAAIVLIWCFGMIVHVTYRILIFRLIYKKGPLIENPINVLILVDEIQWMTQLLHHPQMFYILYIKDLEEEHEQSGCLFLHVFVLVGVFSILQFLYGGLAIACLRFMYIRAYQFLDKIGKLPLTLVILAGSQWMIFWLTIMYVYNKNRRWDIDFCWEGLNQMMVLEPPKGIIALAPLACMLETTIHIYLSYFLYKQDKQVRHMIPEESYKRRNIKNAIDLAGQMLRFFFEMLVLVFILIGSQESTRGSKIYISLTVMVGSALIPAYHIYMSGILKQELHDLILDSYVIVNVKTCYKENN